MKTNRPRRVLAKGAAVAAAVATLGIVAAGTASADTTAQPQADVHELAFASTVPAASTIAVSPMTCPAGYFLINQDYSPGRAVPRGVEVIEAGGIGVTISNIDYRATPDGKHLAPVGTNTDGASSATNWDPFTQREVAIYLNCTTDLSKTTLFQP